MYVDNELVEFVPMDDQEYEEIIEEYEKEILVQEKPWSLQLLTLPSA